MASKVSIYNNALILIGQKTLTDTTDDSATARDCNVIYDQVLDEELAAGPEKGWRFARTRASISVDATAPAFEFDYRFAVPNDCLRPVEVQVDGLGLTDWIREGDYILTNEEDSEIDMVYVKRVTETGKFPPHFVKVLYYSLAVALAERTTKDTELGSRIYQKLQTIVLPKAIGIDSKEFYVEESNNSWQEAGR